MGGGTSMLDQKIGEKVYIVDFFGDSFLMQLEKKGGKDYTVVGSRQL